MRQSKTIRILMAAMCLAACFLLSQAVAFADEDIPQEEQVQAAETTDESQLISIEDAEVTLSDSSFQYDGMVHLPEIVTVGGMSLAEGVDYEAAWSEDQPKNAGTYSVTITGKGEYAGTTRAEYSIEKAMNPMSAKGMNAKVIYDKVKKADQTVNVSRVRTILNARGTVTYSKTSGNKKILIDKKTGKVTVKRGITSGTHQVKMQIKAAGDENYNAGSVTITFKIIVTNVTASTTILKKDGMPFDVRKEAGQKLYKYDTLQGVCAHNGYAYMALYNRNVEKCKIVKVKLKTCEVVKVSGPLAVYHANNLTYNTKKNKIVATACQVKSKRAVFVDPKTLKVVYKKDIKLTKKVKNLPSKVRKKYKGFTAIAYNEKNNCYVGRLRNDNNVIIFNGDLKPVRYVKLKGKKTYLLNQGMESVGNYIYDVRSFKGKSHYSLVTIHTMSGKYVGKLRFAYGKAPGNELECIFHDGKQFYAGFYYTTSQYHDTKANHVKRTNTIYQVHNLKQSK